MKFSINQSGKILSAFFMVSALLWGTACTDRVPSGSGEKGHETQKETHGAGKDPKGKEKEHAGEDGHGDGKAIRLTEAQRKEFGIELATAGSGPLKVQVELPGEIVPNADR
ncbi:MAG TPA: hypothetical protein VGA54_11920, partial [Candidatus Deferrimicrobium sp.]